MRAFAFGKRCAKEILRDPLNLAFGIGFPMVLLLLLSAIQANIPVNLFEIKNLAPGITIFGLSFITLFSATLVAKDRESAFLQRLYTSPLKPIDFIAGYMLPNIPIALAQCVICYLIAIVLGMPITINILYAILIIIPFAVFQVALGVALGSILNVKQVGGVCGALLTNLSAWLSGIWFDLNLVGDAFKKGANLLPYVHAVELAKAVLNGEYDNLLPHFCIVTGYMIFAITGAVLLFMRQMKKQ